VIALVLSAALAAPPAPASGTAPSTAGGRTSTWTTETRMPGTWMRLGATEETILARAQFPVVHGPGGDGTVRQGNAFWFGIAGQVTLHFRDARLEQAEFKIEEAAPYQVDYARDQLRLAGYRARCEEDEPALQVCDWRGATQVRFELRESKLLATIGPVELAGPPAAPPSRPAAARRDTVPVFPEVFVLGRGAPAGVRPPALADSTPLLAPPYPASAREAGVQGRVWVRVLVDTTGAVEAAQVVRSIAELDSAAVAVARRCRFVPYESQGARVRFRVEIPVLFTTRTRYYWGGSKDPR
jgi:TonB family protein